jgi:hypothetical protein
MSRVLAATLAVLALLLSACAGSPRPLTRITAACPLLLSVETGFYLDSDLVPVEQDYGGANETLYACDYKRGAEPIVGLIVREFPLPGLTAAEFIESTIRRGTGFDTIPLPGVGEAAIFLKHADLTGLVAAKRSGPNMRVISFNAAERFDGYRLAALAAIVMARL